MLGTEGGTRGGETYVGAKKESGRPGEKGPALTHRSIAVAPYQRLAAHRHSLDRQGHSGP